MKKILFLIIGTWVIFSGILMICPRLSRDRLNIILITFDALRPDHLECYGYQRKTSSFLNSIAAKSLVYENCVALAAESRASIAALFTAKFSFVDEVLEDDLYLKDEEFTLAEFLKTKGYYTMGIVEHPLINIRFNYSQGFDWFLTKYMKEEEMYKVLRERLAEAATTRKKKPTFLYIHIMKPHWPFDRCREYFHEFANGQGDPQDKKNYKMFEKTTLLSDQELLQHKNQYDACVRSADVQLSQIFHVLGEAGVLKNAAIFVSSDHGEMLGEKDIIGHNEIHYRSLRVPLIVSLPQRLPARIHAPVSLLDIYPTIVDLAGGVREEIRRQFRGKSLFAKDRSGHVLSLQSGYRALTSEEFRLIVSPDEEVYLYNIKNDPDETTDLSREFPDIADGLRKQLNEYDLSGPPGPGKEDQEDQKHQLNEAELEALRSLGYLQ